MPIFEYQCQTCGTPFEELILSSAAVAEPACPDCGSNQVRKKVSTFAAKVSGKSSFSFNTTQAPSCNTGST